jgi:hypothetical protein
MRSIVVRESGHPLRFAKHFSGSGFFRRGALRGLSRNRGRGWNRLRGGSRPACRSRGAGRTGRRLAPHRRRESIPGSPATAARWARRFDSPAPFGGLSLRAPASPASKTPPRPRRFSMSKDGAGGGGMAMFSFPPGDAERRNAGKPNTPAPTDAAAAVWRKLRRECGTGISWRGRGNQRGCFPARAFFQSKAKTPDAFRTSGVL